MDLLIILLILTNSFLNNPKKLFQKKGHHKGASRNKIFCFKTRRSAFEHYTWGIIKKDGLIPYRGRKNYAGDATLFADSSTLFADSLIKKVTNTERIKPSGKTASAYW